MSIEMMVNYYKGRDLSGVDIKTLTGRAPVLYSDLKNFSSIKELLGNFHFVILLYQTSAINTGHFVCLRENDEGSLSFSDSYGYKFDTETHLGATYDQRFPPYLTQLIAKDGRVCDWNKYDYQRKSGAVATCGRYSAVFAMWRNLSFEEIKGIFTLNTDPWLNQPDNLVVVMTVLPLSNIREFFQQKNNRSIPNRIQK